MGSRWRIGAIALAWTAILAACNALTSVGDYTYDGVCRVDADCEDDNPCTIDICTGRLCSHDATTATPPPIRGNCSEESCASGAIVLSPDLGDNEDGDPCTDDYCPDIGGDVHVPKKSGDGCGIGALSGTCQGGDCRVSCDVPGSCDLHDPCVKGKCVGGVCDFTEADAGTPCGSDGGTCSAGGVCG
jgi:hypothetical protein